MINMIYVYIDPQDGATYWTDKEENVPANAKNLTIFNEPFEEVYRLRVKTLDNGEYEFYLEPIENILKEKFLTYLNGIETSLAETIKNLYPIEKQVSDKSDFDFYSVLLNREFKSRKLDFSDVLEDIVHSAEDLLNENCESTINEYCALKNLSFILENETLKLGLVKIAKYFKRIYWLEKIRKEFSEKRKALKQKTYTSEDEMLKDLYELETNTLKSSTKLPTYLSKNIIGWSND